MLTAILSDIHANLAALDACLRDARERGAERFVFLGDLVGYGPDPAAVIDRIRAIEGAVVIQGNHDQAVRAEPNRTNVGEAVYRVLVYTREALSDEQRRFLDELPLILREPPVCFVHASADQPERWTYVEDSVSAGKSMDAAGTPYVFSGHVHDQALFYKTATGKVARFRPTSGAAIPVPRHRSWLALVGSVGQPRDGNPAAAYALFDEPAERLTFLRVPYDHLATVRRLRETGLPSELSKRLEQGL